MLAAVLMQTIRNRKCVTNIDLYKQPRRNKLPNLITVQTKQAPIQIKREISFFEQGHTRKQVLKLSGTFQTTLSNIFYKLGGLVHNSPLCIITYLSGLSLIQSEYSCQRTKGTLNASSQNCLERIFLLWNAFNFEPTRQM